MAGLEEEDGEAENRRPPAASVQLQTIQGLIKDTPMVAGQTWYVVSEDWWRQFLAWGKEKTSLPPGPIDNANLRDPAHPTEVRRDVNHAYDYELVPAGAWAKLKLWHKLRNEHDALPRLVVEEGFKRQTRVEVIRPGLFICHLRDIGSPDALAKIFISKHATIGALKAQVCSVLGTPNDNNRRLWLVFAASRRPHMALAEMGATIEDARINDGDVIALDERVNGSWGTLPEPGRGVSSALPAPPFAGFADTGRTAFRRQSTYHTLGVCGLQNLGNTCFMNSALQCLSNTPQLTNYILQMRHLDEINRENALGMGGQMAEEYATLITHLWDGRSSAIAPREFKHKLGLYEPRFSGYQQQDSQEVLAFLLDGLHEDLNRVRKKPYVEMPDSDDYPDHQELAEIAWRFHRRRNDSIIVDLFQGQFKSTLVCPDCHKISITFDPFMYLSLPLPGRRRRFDITVVALDKPLNTYSIEFPEQSQLVHLKAALSRQCGIAPQRLQVACMYHHKVEKIYQNSDIVKTLSRENLFAYEIDEPDGEARRLVTVSHVVPEDIVALPLVISVPSGKVTVGLLKDLVATALTRFARANSDYVNVNGVRRTRQATRDNYSSSAMDIEDDADRLLDQLAGDIDAKLGSSPLDGMYTVHIQQRDGLRECEVPFRNDRDEILLGSGETCAQLRWPIRLARSVFSHHTWPGSELRRPDSRAGDRGDVTLYECLDLFTQEEELGAEDPWYCPRCKEHKQATKKLDLWRLPDVLVVHLKRFSDSRWHRRKLDTYVDFPLEGLDLTSYVQGTDGIPYIYDLHAISNHMGGLGGGHYTAYARNKNNGQWYLFDDSSTSPIDPSRIKSASAYLLFYTRRQGPQPT